MVEPVINITADVNWYIRSIITHVIIPLMTWLSIHDKYLHCEGTVTFPSMIVWFDKGGVTAMVSVDQLTRRRGAVQPQALCALSPYHPLSYFPYISEYTRIRPRPSQGPWAVTLPPIGPIGPKVLDPAA